MLFLLLFLFFCSKWNHTNTHKQNLIDLAAAFLLYLLHTRSVPILLDALSLSLSIYHKQKTNALRKILTTPISLKITLSSHWLLSIEIEIWLLLTVSYSQTLKIFCERTEYNTTNFYFIFFFLMERKPKCGEWNALLHYMRTHSEQNIKCFRFRMKQLHHCKRQYVWLYKWQHNEFYSCVAYDSESMEILSHSYVCVSVSW